MKIDESVIAKVLDNKASPEEARKVAGWFATEEGNKYLSERFDWEIGMLSEEMPESIDPHSIPEVKMKVRFMNEIKCERGQRPVGRRWMWVAAVLLPFVFLSVSLFFLANRTGIFSEPEYADINVPCSIVRWSFGEKGISMLPKMRTALLRWICKGWK